MLKLQRFYHPSLNFPPWAGKLTDVLTKIFISGLFTTEDNVSEWDKAQKNKEQTLFLLSFSQQKNT